MSIFKYAKPVAAKFMAAPIFFSVVFGTGDTIAGTIEEIIVTAQKRAQSVQDVPIAITSLTGEEVDALGMRTAADVQYQIPGLIVSYSSTNAIPNFVLRGVGLNDFTAIQSSPVAVHVDEVYYGNSTLLNFQLFDIERVEALKGPQGTLYGRNSTGGSVNFFSNKPTEEFEAGLDLGYANYEAYTVEGFVSGPLSETLSGRLSFNVSQQDGGPFTHPSLGEIGELDRYAVRGQLLWDVSEDLSAHLLVFGGQDDSEGNQYEGVPTFTNDAEFNICGPVMAGDLEPSDACSFDGEGAILRDDDDPYTLQKALINRDEIDAFGVVFSADYDLGFATLTSISAYNTADRKSQEDADGTVVRSIDVGYETDFEQFTEELRLSSPGDGRWVWTIGLFYSADELETPRTETDAGDFDFRQNHAYILETDSFAAFWHNEFRLTERFSVTAGIRYTDEERSFKGGTINVDFGSGPTGNGDFVASPGPLPGDYSDPAIFDEAYIDEEISFNEVSWSVGASMDISDTVMVYAGISNGFKSGGFIGDITVQEILQEPYDEETLTAYEVGLKADLLEGALRWNTSLFYYDYEDAILALSVDGTGVVDSLLINENAADAEVYGVESEIWYAPTEDLDIKFGVTYLDTETEGIPTSPFNVQERLDGNELPYAPEFSANGLVRYQAHIADGWTGRAQFDFTTRSDHWGESDNINVSKLDGYTLLNARVGLGSETGNWSVGVWCKNLTDKEYFIYVNNLQAFGSILRTPGFPRTYGVDLSLRF